MRAYRSLLQRLGRTRWFAWFGAHVLTRVDTWFGLRIPTPSTLGTGLPVFHLTTTGRRSGEERRSPLLYLEDGRDYVVAATNYGRRHHPAWSYNLDAEPAASVHWRGGRSEQVVARRASPAEIERHWPRFTEMWSGYDSYRERAAHRDIRVYVLAPAPDTGDH